MRSEVLDMAARRKMFLSPDALEAILSNNDPIEFAHTVLSSLADNPMFVTAQDIQGFLVGDSTVFASPKAVKPRNKRQPDISVAKDSDITGNSTCEGKIDDFARYFKHRYNSLKRMLAARRDFGFSGMGVKDALGMDREVKVIVIVSDVSTTKNGHRILTAEDDTGVCKVLISKDSPLADQIIVTDEVIGITGRPAAGREMVIAGEIFRPDIPMNNRWTPSDSVASVAFLSDVHVGSDTFLKNRWDGMVSWMKRNAYDMDIDYVVLPGDAVDGIGIFPGQEKELRIHDIYEQYRTLAEYLKELPDHIRIVVQPGNHDAVRPAEPQPAMDKMFTETFDSNVMMTGNPVYLDIEGRRVLTYHGRSIDDWVSGVQQLTYDDPVRIMREMLHRRHMAPIYGHKTALAPEKKDYLMMEHVPDIFVTGHVHGVGWMDYHGVKTINASAWQDQTEYQKMHNFNPQPAIMPVVHLGTGKVEMKVF